MKRGGTWDMAVRRPATAVEWSAPGINATFANVLVSAALIYTLLFDALDEKMRLAVAGILGIGIVLRCLVSWPRPAGQTATFLFVCLALVSAFQFVFVADPLAYAPGEYTGPALRLMTCVAVFVYFNHEDEVVSPRLLVAVCISILMIALWAVVTGEPVDYAGTMRPATFTGGLEGVHSSAYVAAAALIGVIVLWQVDWLGRGWLLVFGTPLLALVLAYQVRTAWLMIASFSITSLILHWRRRSRDGTWLLLPVGALVLPIALAFGGDVDYRELSSGRTSAYEERLDLIAGRSVLELLFGTGPGSELLPSTVWWWEPKNSHNDFIDLAIQTGLFGLALFVLLLVVTWRVLDDVRRPLFVMFVASSLFSNGLLARPFVAVLFLAFALVPRNPQADTRKATAGRMPLPA